MPTVTQSQAERPLILTIDVGSSSVRASLFDARAYPVKDLELKLPYQLDTSPDGGVDKDPDFILNLIYRALDQLLTLAGPLAQDISAVAVDTFWHSLIGLDDDGNAITPVITWADTRSNLAAEQLRQELDEKDIHNRTGCLIHPSYFPAKLRWLATSRPEIFKEAARFVSIGEYLYLKLFGQASASYSMASGTGLLNRQTCQWDQDLLAYLKITPQHLLPLSDLDQPQQGLNHEFAGRWPALQKAKWYPAVGDGASGNIGGGCFSPERISIMVGTSGAMRVVIPQVERVPAGLWCYRVDRNRQLLGGALSEGGNLFAWMRQTLHLPDLGELETEISQLAPDAHGLTVLPFLSGERAPGWAGNARATITGLSLNTSPQEILRAGLEAIAYRFGLVHDLLEPAVPQVGEIIASGGALLNSPLWMQIIADVLNRPVIASGENETSSRGAALLALEQMGMFGLENASYDFGQTFQPDPGRHQIYRQAMKRQQELYHLLVKPAA